MITMTEKQRMLAGELYLASDAELVADRLRARDMVREYNETSAAEIGRRLGILSRLFGRVGPRVEIEPPFRCDYGYNIFAGDGLYMNFGCVVLDCAPVHIGDNVSFGPYVQLCPAHHPTDPEIRRTGQELADPFASARMSGSPPARSSATASPSARTRRSAPAASSPAMSRRGSSPPATRAESFARSTEWLQR